MPTKTITLVKGDKVGAETDYRDALPVNMIAINKPIFGAQGYMLQYPGLVKFSESTDTSINRGGIWNERFSDHYRVNGNRFYSVTDSGFQIELGSVINDSLTVSLPYSFNTQGIISSGRFYLYDPVNGFREVTDPDLGSPIDGVWVDGLYFFTDGEFIFHTDITDESSIDPLKFATAEFMPDKSLGVGKTQDNKVIVFGRYTMEYFINVAQDNFSFQRVPTRAIKIGIVSTHCKTELSGVWYILGGRKEECISCHEVTVGRTTKIATREIDKIIGTYSEEDLKDTVLEAYTEDGYDFVVHHLPNETLLFNKTLAKLFGIEQAWTVIRTGVCTCGIWRGRHFVFDVRLGEWVVGDRLNGNLGILSETDSNQYDMPTEWLLFTPFVYLDDQSIDKLEIETIPGFTGSDDSSVFISCTRNGHTYSKEWIEIYGGKGEYKKRFIIRRLGYIRNWFGFKLRGLTKSRMAFSRGFIDHG